jgi:protein-disulfide isomerase
MTKANSSVRGSAIPVILLIVSVIAIGFASWSYVSKVQPAPEEALEAQTDEGAPVIAMPAPEDQVATADTYAGVPVSADDALAPAAEATASETTSDEKVTIDVAKAMSPRSLGNANAPIKIVEYASLTCSHCAHFHNDILPALKTKYIDTGKVYMEFREFPLDDAALKGTLTARCLPEEKYESFVSLLFKSQHQWAHNVDYMNTLKQNAKLAGMSDATFEACHNEPMLKMQIAESMQVGKDQWKIAATPTFIINDGAETIQGAQPLESFERVFRKVTNGAVGEAPAVE